MKFNGHLLLLLVASGLFVRVWSANDRSRARQPALARSETSRALSIRQSTRSPEVRTVSAQRTFLAWSTAFPAEERWTSATAPIPLPAGIVAGTYRVANDTGRVALLEIAPAGAAHDANGDSAPPECCTTTISASRWYFIRLHEAPATRPVIRSADLEHEASTPDSSATSDRRPLTNRKFDFTGYLSADALDGIAIDEVDRPQPPHLPTPG